MLNKPANARYVDIDRQGFVDLLVEAAEFYGKEERKRMNKQPDAAGLRHWRGRRGRHPAV